MNRILVIGASRGIGLELVLILIAVLAFFGNEMPEPRRCRLRRNVQAEIDGRRRK